MHCLLGASGGEGGGGKEESDTNFPALSDLQSEIWELRKKLETLEEEKQKALEKAEREMSNLRRPGLMDKIKRLFRK